mmetsp:Transcript_52900/g.172121  ORF Transcript_52900/g.172121 Transcript_52900/m.172121 type:complete len:233 (+) Transcript_52900:575-1273(+)
MPICAADPSEGSRSRTAPYHPRRSAKRRSPALWTPYSGTTRSQRDRQCPSRRRSCQCVRCPPARPSPRIRTARQHPSPCWESRRWLHANGQRSPPARSTIWTKGRGRCPSSQHCRQRCHEPMQHFCRPSWPLRKKSSRTSSRGPLATRRMPGSKPQPRPRVAPSAGSPAIASPQHLGRNLAGTDRASLRASTRMRGPRHQARHTQPALRTVQRTSPGRSATGGRRQPQDRRS